jgi:prolyl-tRNA editing enzyme YbaK/EbsC (Cys-tRNA(Pro) deacylase)
LLADRSVFQEDEISIGSGVRYTTVIMRKDDFVKSLGAVEVGDFAAVAEHPNHD